MGLIIGISGHAGSGKDTACKYLQDVLHFRRTSFAEPLKKMVREAFPKFTDNSIYGPSEEREQLYEDYPFRGICLTCSTPCSPHPDPTHRRVWHCDSCHAWYPRYITPRVALQTLGTEWGRTLCADIWVKACIDRIVQQPEYNWCISDLRFNNEANYLRKVGGKVIRLTRASNERASVHQSEREIYELDVDADIDNSGPIPKLEQALGWWVDHFNRQRIA